MIVASAKPCILGSYRNKGVSGNNGYENLRYSRQIYFFQASSNQFSIFLFQMLYCCIFRCVCVCELLHSSCHFPGEIFRHLSATTLSQVANAITFLQDNYRLLGSWLSRLYTHSCFHKIPEETLWKRHLPGSLGRSRGSQDVYDSS